MLLKQSLVNNVGDFVWSAEQTFIYDSLVPLGPGPQPSSSSLLASSSIQDTYRHVPGFFCGKNKPFGGAQSYDHFGMKLVCLYSLD